MPRTIRLLLGARGARSLGQGVTVVSFSLYLRALGYSGSAIGTVLMAGLMFGAALTAVVGPLSDRRGRRRLLIFYEIAAAAAALAAALSRNEAVLIAAATVAGFGRGANGAAGPFAPVEQAWLAREVHGIERRRVFALNAGIGFVGMAVGAALAAAPRLVGRGFGDIATYRLLFLIPFTASLAAIALVGAAHDSGAGPAASALADADRHRALVRHENRQLRRLALTNIVNGFAIGIIGPLIAYWFARRFGRGPESIGPALAAGFLLGALGSVLNGWISVRVGAVRSVLWMRGVGLISLIATPFAETFVGAAGCYSVRAMFNQGTAGARQVVASELTRAERRGLAASVQSLSLQIPRAAGPVLGGWLMQRGQLVAPFLVAAVLQGAYLFLYGRYFSAVDRQVSET
ncbi:MAG: MFS transporter [Vicinamibacterales bacterium]